MDSPYAVLARQYTYCVVCGSTENLEQHHVIPRSQGGGEEGNLVMLCRECHRKRHAGLIDISLHDNMLVVKDKQTGEIRTRPIVPQVATGPSELVDQARAVQNWLGLMVYADRLRQESDEALAALYDELRTLKHRLWMAQAAVIAEMQTRANYGDGAAKHIASALGCSERTVQSRGQIYREIIAKPECAQACERVLGESWYKEAVSHPDPVWAINYADERKIENPSYTVAQFRAELHSDGDESSLVRVVLYCRRKNAADERLAESLELRLGVPVTLLFDEVLTEVLTGPVIGNPGRTLGTREMAADLGKAIAL